METFDRRFRSFDKHKSKSSNKASTARAWPHPKSFIANPTSLAEAGFFFKPSQEDPDNVQCFLCKKELGGWDQEDNPFDVHIKKCPKCPWAVARCSLEFDVDSNGKFAITDSARLPTNKVLEKARADTFGGKKWWPHDTVKNHGATSKKMAKAGFVYTPQAEGDDTATCFYCDLSLSGWDAEDDPTEEHIKRVERSGKPCPFFQTTERPKSQTSTKSSKSTSRKSRAPKQASIPSDEEDDSPTVKAPIKKDKQRLNALEQPAKSSKLSDSEETEDLEEDDDPSLKVKPAPAPRKISSEEVEESEVEVKRLRSRSKSVKGSRREQEKEKAMDRDEEKESSKPPSNVDGKVAKSYKDFTMDINAAEEAKTADANKGKRRETRSRSRSKSRPRSADASTSVDLKSKPLALASSRSRVSGITEVEEMETERMLEEPPSEPEPKKAVEKKPPSKARRRTRVTKGKQISESDDKNHSTSYPPSKPASVASEKSTSGQSNKLDKESAKKTAAKAKGKALDSRPAKSIKPASQDDELFGDANVQDVEDVQETTFAGPHMDVDLNHPRERVPGGHSKTKDNADSADHLLFPTPASPSDFKTAPMLGSKEVKTVLKQSSDLPDHTHTLGITPARAQIGQDENLKPTLKSRAGQKPTSRKGKPTPRQFKEQADSMDVDENHHHAHEREDLNAGSERSANLKPSSQPFVCDNTSRMTPEPNTKPPSRPTTPEDQIMRPKTFNMNAETTDFRSSLHVPPSPADLFLPPLANVPIQVVAALTDEERAMTVEQWIRHEMAVQYERLKEDGERRIQAFLERAEETRRRIEAL